MLIPKEIAKTQDNNLDTAKSTQQKMVKETAISQFEQAMNAPLVKANTKGDTQDPQSGLLNSKSRIAHKKKEPTQFSPLALLGEQESPHGTSDLTSRHLSRKAPPSQKAKRHDDSQVDKKEHNENAKTDVPPTHHTLRLDVPVTKEGAIKKEHNEKTKADEAPAHQTLRLDIPVTKEIAIKKEHISSEVKPFALEQSTPLKHTLNQTFDTKVTDHQALTKRLNPAVNEAQLTPLNKQQLQSTKNLEEHIPNQGANQINNTPGNIILANIKTHEPLNQQLHTLVNQIIERVQILVPNLANQDRVQLVIEQGRLKGTEVIINIKNNQLTVTLVHSNQNTELLQQLRPELLERLQKMNTDQQVRIITSHHEQQAHGGQQEQDQQQESSQKSRVINDWLEEQNNA